MGIKRLEDYILSNAQTSYTEVSLNDIKEVLFPVRASVPDEKLKVLVDGTSFLNFAYYKVGKLGWYYEAEWIGFREAISHCVRKLDSYGLSPVFFFKADCPVPSADHPSVASCIAERLTISRSERQATFKTLVSNSQWPVEDLFFKHLQLPITVHHKGQILLKEMGLEIRTGLGERRAMALYAKHTTEDFAAALCDSTDFFVFDLTCEIFLLRGWDFEREMIKKFDKQALSTQLNMDKRILPLLAALTPNRRADVKDDLTKFLRERGLLDNDSPFYDLERVAKFVNHTVKTSGGLQQLQAALPAGYLQSVLNFYSLTPDDAEDEVNFDNGESEWQEIIHFAKTRMSEILVFRDIYELLQHKQYFTKDGSQDYEGVAIPTSGQLLEPVLRRLYGFVFREKRPSLDGKPFVVHEYGLGYGFLPPGETRVFPTSPKGEHPTLSALWKVRPDGSTQDLYKRWGVLLAILTPKLWEHERKRLQIVQLITDLPGHLTMVVLTVIFLQTGYRRPLLDSRVLDAFLAQAVMVSREETLPAEMENFTYGLVNTQTVHLTSLFGSVALCIELLVAVIGHPIPWQETMPWKFYDGRVFGICMDRGTYAVQADSEEATIFSKLKSVVNVVLNSSK